MSIRVLSRMILVPLLAWAAADSASGAQDAAAARQYAAAADLQGRGDYALAATAWQKFIAEHKSDERIARAVQNLGVCYYQQGKYPEALAVFQKTVSDYPQSDVAAAAQLHLGATQFALARAGQRALYDHAVSTLRDLADKHPQGDHLPDAYYYLGEASYALARRQDAVVWYSRLVEKHPNHRFAADAIYALAVAQEESGDHAAAAKSYGQFLARFPSHRLAADARLAGARCLALSGRYDEARGPLNQAIASGGAAAAEAAHWLAQSLVKQKRPQEALAVLDRIGPSGSKTPWAARLLADRADAIYTIADRRKESIPLYAEIAEKHPKDPAAPQALYMAGLAALEVGDFATAFGHAARFPSAYPVHALAPDALQLAAESQLQLGKLPEAEALYGQLVQKYPDHSNVPSWKIRRALTLHAQKKYEETIRALEPLLTELRTPDRVAEAHYLVGASQLAIKQPSAAVKSLAASLEAQPAWRQAFETCLALADAHRQMGDLPSAQAATRRAIKSFPESRLLDQAYFRLGTCLTLAGQADAAVEAYRKLVAQWPASPLAPLALHELGCAQLSSKDAAGAEATFNKLLGKPPQPALARKARYARAMARQQQGKPAEAAADLDAVLAAWPNAKEKSDARFLLGVCQVELKQYDKAAATFRALLTEDSKYDAREESLHQWAWALKRAGRNTEALEIFARLAAEYPKGPLAPEAQFNVAESQFHSKNYAAAAQGYFAVVQNAGATPFAEKAAWHLAVCYYRQGNFADARKTFAYYQTKYADRPQAAEAAFMEAECLFKQAMAAEALAAYARLKPSSDRETQAAVFLHAGQAAGQLGRWAESADWLERLVRELPDSPALSDAFCELGIARQNLGKPAEAIVAYQQAIAKSDREPAARAQLLIGKIQSDQNDRKAALNSFLRVVYGYSYPKWQAEAAFEAARCHEALGQKPQAIGMFQEILDKFPKSEQAETAKKRLAELKNRK